MNDLSTLHEQYKEAPSGTHYRLGTPPALIATLERARENRYRVAVIYEGDSVPEFGRVGRSTGSLKVPLLVHNARSSGGGEICTRIVREVRTAAGGHLLYAAEAKDGS
jgi:hypothetical protein